MTNRVKLWYVPVGESEKVMTVPPMPYKSREQEAIGRDVYEEQKAYRSKSADIPSSFCRDTPGAICLSVLVGVNDVTFNRYCRAGVLLKLMDECAGIVAAKHCQTNVVTACLNTTNFYRMIPIGSDATWQPGMRMDGQMVLMAVVGEEECTCMTDITRHSLATLQPGSLVTVCGLLTFTSNRSMEIEVVVEYESVLGKQPDEASAAGKVKAVDAFFTFVAIDNDGKATPVPVLVPTTDEGRARFEAGQLRYEDRRRKQLQRQASA